MSSSSKPTLKHEETAEVSDELSEEDTKQSTTQYRPTSPPQTGFSAKWTAAINSLERQITRVLRVITRHAATNPKSYVVGIIVLSLAVMATGIFTNFSVDVNDDTLWTPAGSKPVVHMEWIEDTLPADPRAMLILVHANGNNVVSQEGTDRTFEVLDAVRNLEEYDTICSASNHTSDDNVTTCNIEGMVSFWNDSTTIYQDSVNSDEDVMVSLASTTYPNGRPVDLESIVGNPVFTKDNNNTVVTSAQSFLLIIEFPDTEEAEEFEADVIERLLDLQDEWDRAQDFWHVEIMAERSFDDEFSRAIVNDIPLVPLVFTVMSIFTCLIFAKPRNAVQSRSLMGFGAVIAVLLAIMTGYGLLFIIGVPFTSMTQILPFIMFGIGLDDAFIITGEYGRTDSNKDTVERIDETIQAVGLSISLTTITSVLAFGLGAISSIPAVYWLCLYAFPTLAINFLYQVTFFVAVIVIDEQRIKDNRRDCCVCITASTPLEEETPAFETTTTHQDSMADRVMLRFADFLLRPWVKALVIVLFSGMLAGFAYSASLLEQEFKFTDVLPGDSYITEFYDAFDVLYSRGSLLPYVYFRYVDQSDPDIQAQMETYVNEFVAIDAIEEQPTFFWLRDFKEYQTNHSDTLADLTFNQQLDAFLSIPENEILYGEDIFRDAATGDITVSRVRVAMSNVEIDNVKNQIDVMEDQRAVTKSQPINQGKSDWPFFAYDQIYNIWEFYSVAVDELILTTIIGVVAVTGVTFLLVPHWTAALFVLPLISILYVDMLGFLQMAGAHVNAVSYISLVMSIGLLVDFVVHVLLRYYECEGNRDEKVRETLRTMGSSIMIGAISTFLGIIPLGFSTSEIFSTIFIAFVGLVVLGSLHGLVLLPVVLSLIGPEDCIRPKIDGPERVQESHKTVPVHVVSQEDIDNCVTLHEV